MSRFTYSFSGAAILCAVTLISSAVAGPTSRDQAEGRVSMSKYRGRSPSGIQQVGHEVQPANGGETDGIANKLPNTRTYWATKGGHCPAAQSGISHDSVSQRAS